MRIAEFLQSQLDAGLTRSELARRIGVHPSYITRWLSGTLPERTQCQQIAEALGVPHAVVLRMAGREVDGDEELPDGQLGPAQAAALAVATRIINEVVPEEFLTNFSESIEHLGRAYRLAEGNSRRKAADVKRDPEEHAGNDDGRDIVKQSVLDSAYLARLPVGERLRLTRREALLA